MMILSTLRCKKSEEEDDDEREDVVIVSGALGFIGSHCVEHLLRETTLRDIVVVGIDVTSRQLGPCPMGHKKANLKRLLSSNKKSDDDAFVFVEGYLSLSAMDAMEKQLKNVIFDDDDGKKKKKRRRRRIGVVHCAGQSGVHSTLDDPMGAFRANVETTATMIELAKRLRGNFVLLSSGATYGDGAEKKAGAAAGDGAGKMVASKEEEGVMGDDGKSMPTSPYAFSKIACEAVVRSYGRAFEEMEKKITISRIFTCFGNRGRPDMAISRFMRTLLSNGDESEKKLTMFGDGDDTWRDYCHVSDVCSGIEKALWREKGSTCETVNISRGEAVTLGRLVSAVQKAASDELKSTSDDAVVIEKLPKRPGDVGGTFADVTKAKLLLDFEAKISLEDGIASVAKWYNSDEAKQYT
jgi:UDP-glucuronate 4-epimerase